MRVTRYYKLQGTSKNPLLRLGRSFRPNNALQKAPNTQSIPDFLKRLLKQNSTPQSSKQSFERRP